MNDPVAAKPGRSPPAALEQVVEADEGEDDAHRHDRPRHGVADDADPVGDPTTRVEVKRRALATSADATRQMPIVTAVSVRLLPRNSA